MKTKKRFVVLIVCFWILSACQSAQITPTTTASTTSPTATAATIAPPTASSIPPTALPYPSMQLDNNLPLIPLVPKPSRELADNHIGVHFEDYERYRNTNLVFENGFKWVRIQSVTEFWADNRIDLKTFDLTSVPPYVDNTISEYASNDVKVVLGLWMGAGLRPYGTTFESKEEISQFSDYVHFMVSHFTGKILNYEIWNEPGDIAVSDYANLVRAVVPVIREEDPKAKVIIGAIPGSWENGYPGYGKYQRFKLSIEYLNELLVSGVAPMVNGISWHPFYDNIPSDPYYQDYPKMVEGIKSLAASQGFTGEYYADELLWRTVSEEGWAGGPPVSAIIADKYYIRAITLHRGLGVNVTMNTFFIEPEREWIPKTALASIHNLADTLAGAEPINLEVSISSRASNMMDYSFSLPNGDKLVALWTNGEAVENDPGQSATITTLGFSPRRVVGVDVLHGFEQEIVFEAENGNTIIHNLQVKDYPIFLRFVD